MRLYIKKVELDKYYEDVKTGQSIILAAEGDKLYSSSSGSKSLTFTSASSPYWMQVSI